ncbi:MAG: HAD-IIB family hydrolase [Planctomycetes bacterium]|nr:HAD-IIB family hydrolase [Planctomycetota bacterium]
MCAPFRGLRAAPPMRVIFTDLDGTLLDAATYSFEPARSALLQCRAKGIPVVFCTSKTRAETEHFRRLTGNEHPFIVENGGAVYVPAGPLVVRPSGRVRGGETSPEERPHGRTANGAAPHGYFRDPVPSAERVGDCWRIRLGKDYAAILRVMERLKSATGGAVRGFHDMTVEEIATRCGLALDQARLAREREFDEPFVIERDSDRVAPARRPVRRNPQGEGESPEGEGAEATPEAAMVQKALSIAAEDGMHVTAGGRFHHLHGGSDKGAAIRRLMELYRGEFEDYTSIGIGDAANDLPMLQAVDRPCAVARPDGACDPVLRAGVPGLEFIPDPGPRGWSVIIHRLLGTG